MIVCFALATSRRRKFIIFSSALKTGQAVHRRKTSRNIGKVFRGLHLFVGAENDAGGTFNFLAGEFNALSFMGNLVNEGGMLAPGTSPGVLTILGDYHQLAGSLLIEIGGPAAGTSTTKR